MIRKHRAHVRWVVLAVALQTGSALEGQELKGVQVAKVDHSSPAEQSGLQPGDLIETWSSEKSSGSVESPFSLKFVENEQAPLGEVRLRGQRAGQPMEWSLTHEEWGLSVQPIIPARYQAELASVAQSMKGAKEEGVLRLLSLANKARKDDKLFAAWLFQKAGESHHGSDHLRESVQAYEQAILLVNQNDAVILLIDAAVNAKDGDAPTTAASLARRAEQLLQATAPKSLTMVRCWNVIVDVQLEKGDFQAAAKTASQSLALAQSIAPAGLDTARCLHNLGAAASSLGQLDEAENYLQQSYAIKRQRLPNSMTLVKALHALGTVASRRGDSTNAQKYFADGLALLDRLPPAENDLPAQIRSNLGVAEVLVGNIELGEQHLLEAVEIYRRTNESRRAGLALLNLGALCLMVGDANRAEDFLKQGKMLLKEWHGSVTELARADFLLGNVALQRGDSWAAKRLFREVLARQEAAHTQSVNDQQDLINTLLGLTEAAQGTRSYDEASTMLDRAISLQQRLKPQGIEMEMLLGHYGQIELARGNWSAAKRYFERELEMSEIGEYGREYEPEALSSLGGIAWHFGNREEANAYYDQSIAVVEAHATNFGNDENAKSHYEAYRLNYYTDYIEFLEATQQSEKAFLVLERSRARSFLRMLAERDLIFPGEIPEDLRKQQLANARAYEQAQGEWVSVKSRQSAEADAIAQQLRNLQAERTKIQDEIRKSSPRVANLRYPKPLSVADASRALDPGTVLLSYSVAEKHTVLFVLPAGGTLTAFNIDHGQKELRERVIAFRRQIENQASSAKLSIAGAALYHDLLGPAESMIVSADRLLIVPDGPLQMLPFAALKHANQFLVEWKPIHTAVSATVYAQLKAERKSTNQWPDERLVAFGDPQFPRGPDALKNTSAVVRSRVERGMSLVSLPYSRSEVESIAAAYGGKSTLYLGADATEERAKQITNARYIHFATHGVIDEHFPLNSALVLSVPANSSQKSEDGLLDVWEIIENVRWNADLVVLSACRTALGEELAGEGFIGLTRAIQFAGARSVLASLWSVDDRRTAQFMEKFYTHLRDKTKDEALRAAQIDMIRMPDTSPFYWAAFTLSGDWQ